MDRKYSDLMERKAILNEVLDKPLSFNMTRHMVEFILDRMSKLEYIIDSKIERGKDHSQEEYELHRAEFILGIIEKEPDIRNYDFYREILERKAMI